MLVLVRIALLLVLLAPPTARAAGLPHPTGPVILTVTGAISRTNDGDKALFDRAMLAGLGLSKIRTTTAWTDGVVEFEGVPVKSLLEAVGSRGRNLHAVAINDYAIDLDAQEFEKIPAMLAMRMNGTELRVRDKGPLWLVYPRDDYPSVRTESYNFKWIWQLKTITVR